jgi:hypothetical protein
MLEMLGRCMIARLIVWLHTSDFMKEELKQSKLQDSFNLEMDNLEQELLT